METTTRATIEYDETEGHYCTVHGVDHVEFAGGGAEPTCAACDTLDPGALNDPPEPTEWITTAKLEVGDTVARLSGGCVWRNRAQAESAPHGWATVQHREGGRRQTVTYTDGTTGTYSPSARQLRRS